MLILDSNVWIHGVTVGSGRSQECLQEIIFGTEECAVSPYIHEEVVTNIESDRSVSREQRDRSLEEFAATVYQCDSIYNPDTAAVYELDLEAERTESYYRLIGDLGDIQPKDAPVLTLAYEYLRKQPTILTDDESFAEFAPIEYGVPELSVEYLPLEWAAPEQTVD